MLRILKDLTWPLIIVSGFYLNYLLFGMILLVLEGELPEEGLALEKNH